MPPGARWILVLARTGTEIDNHVPSQLKPIADLYMIRPRGSVGIWTYSYYNYYFYCTASVLDRTDRWTDHSGGYKLQYLGFPYRDSVPDRTRA